MSDGDIYIRTVSREEVVRSEEVVEKSEGEKAKVDGGQQKKKVCVCFSRLEVTDLEGLPHASSQPEAMSVCSCVFLFAST